MPSTAPKLTAAEMAAIIRRGREAERNRQARTGDIVPFAAKKPAPAPADTRLKTARPAPNAPIQVAPMVEKFGAMKPILSESGEQEEEEELTEEKEQLENETSEGQEIKSGGEQQDNKTEAKEKKEDQEKPALDTASQEKELTEKKEKAKNEGQTEGITPISSESPFAKGQPGGPMGEEAKEARDRMISEAGMPPVAGEGAAVESGAAKPSGREAGIAGGGKISPAAGGAKQGIGGAIEQAKNAQALLAGAGEAGGAAEIAGAVAQQAAKKAAWQIAAAVGGVIIANLWWIVPLLLILALIGIVYYAWETCGLWTSMKMVWYGALSYAFEDGANLAKAIEAAANCVTK